MVVLNPDVVRFDTLVWEDATSVALERASTRTVEEWTDLGAHAAFVDVAEVRTTVRVTRRVQADELGPPPIGHLGELVFYGAPGGTDAGRTRVVVRCVLTAAKSEVNGKDGVQTLTFVGVSTNGTADPLKIEDGFVLGTPAGLK